LPNSFEDPGEMPTEYISTRSLAAIFTRDFYTKIFANSGEESEAMSAWQISARRSAAI
jgi:hypothetical protein